jgi:hypothetical protein
MTFTSALFRVFCFLLCLAASAGATMGQAVVGELRDRDGGGVVPGARLYLLDVAGSAVDSTLTGRDGGYRLTASTPGEYVVYFQIDGWASFGSEPMRLEADSVAEFAFRVPLIHNRAVRQMSAMMAGDPRLQASLPEICGEALQPEVAGLLVGIVRMRSTRQPVAGARVAVSSGGSGVARSTISGDTGVYILCNVPLGAAVEIIAASPDGTHSEATEVEIRAGTISWYDLSLRPRR